MSALKVFQLLGISLLDSIDSLCVVHFPNQLDRVPSILKKSIKKNQRLDAVMLHSITGATVAASAVEEEVEVCLRTAQLINHRRSFVGLMHSSSNPKLDLVSSGSLAQSASDHMTICTSSRSSCDSSERTAMGPAESK